MDFEEFVIFLGFKFFISGILEKFYGIDFDIVFWKVCFGWLGFRVVYIVKSCRGVSEWFGLYFKGETIILGFFVYGMFCFLEGDGFFGGG